ncbi:ThuA domain-containing protein [Solirubrobacter ginsenosidimutans]|uniref:ThuA domain-containing protein n=1 Tax=Solirubrobacter ginsenosidimutans TaxID=490573 RepID=A0A9X3MQR3_9ACTN|nr:ThuA domain-containing protein [Solirubrobacter ginsenosidimutans]
MAVVSPALAADTVAPVVAPAAFSAPPNGNSNWRITAPQTLTLSATDDVAVSKFQYSLDGGATYVDVPVTAGPAATASVPLSQEGNTSVRYRAVDSSGNLSRGATTNTTLNQASTAGATAVRLTSTTGRGAGDSLLIDTGAGQETATIATIVTPAPAAPAPNVTLTAPLANAHAANATVAGTAFYNTITLQIDTKAPIAIWGPTPTTLQPNNATTGAPAAAAGDTQIRLASLTGRAAGDTLQLDRGANAETVKIASVVSPAPAAPAPNVVLTSALTKNHLNGVSVYVPQVVDGKILQSQTLTPTFADPRLADPTDTVTNGAGGSAPRLMTLDGTQVIPKAVALNTLTVGKHTETVSLQDSAGNASKYTNTFAVTTSFADLSTVIDQLANNALTTTLNGATAVGATGLRLATPWGFRPGQQLVIDSGANQETVTVSKALSPPPTVSTTLTAPASAGANAVRIASYSSEVLPGGAQPPSNNGPVVGQPIVLDTGANQEVVTVAKHISPLPAAPAPNVILSAPLAHDHASGTATNLNNVILATPLTKAHATGVTISNPRPIITAAKQTELQGLLADAKTKSDGGDTAGAITSLQSFVTAAGGNAVLSSAGSALRSQLQGTAVDTSGTGVTVGTPEPGVQAIRFFYNPVVPVSIPNAKYKVLITGRAGGYRHESIVDFEWMIQQLGAQNGFDIDIWDPAIGTSPGRNAPAGVSLTTSPFLDPAKLAQYKTIVFDSTVGLSGTSTVNGTEFANLQQYIRNGGGFVSIHGATDSLENNPWYMDLNGAGFTNHGSNSNGGILVDTGAGGSVEYTTADPAHASMAQVPNRFFSVDELYNTNRNPVEMGIVHPLQYENEDSVINQIGYSPGPLMNSDVHPMTWCRNFEGARSYTTVLGHNWQYANEKWFQSMILNAIQWTSGQTYDNCVTFNEVKDMLAAAVAGGGVNAAGNTALSASLASADAAHRAGDDAGAATFAKQFVAQAKNVANVGSDGGKALLDIQSKGVELVNWMTGNEVAPPAPAYTNDQPGTVGGAVPATLALTLGAPATFGAFTPGVAKDYTAATTATVVSTAGDATLSVADPSATATGKLVNGTYSLPQTLQASGGGAFAPVGGSAAPTALKSWSAPTSNESVPVTFKQSIGANDALRTGSYSKTLTFTLSTTTP